jgi:adenine-specific DNA-methyltransferase
MRAFTDYMKQVPIPPFQPAIQDQIGELVDGILLAKDANPTADVSALEREIDQLVYRLYGLTAEEIAIVEAAGK